MTKAVNLTVHKNTRRRRQRDVLARDIAQEARSLKALMADEFCGAALVIFNKDGTFYGGRFWSEHSDVPPACVPELARVVLQSAVDGTKKAAR